LSGSRWDNDADKWQRVTHRGESKRETAKVQSSKLKEARGASVSPQLSCEKSYGVIPRRSVCSMHRIWSDSAT
jgi:hypothetical protein